MAQTWNKVPELLIFLGYHFDYHRRMVSELCHKVNLICRCEGGIRHCRLPRVDLHWAPLQRAWCPKVLGRHGSRVIHCWNVNHIAYLQALNTLASQLVPLIFSVFFVPITWQHVLFTCQLFQSFWTPIFLIKYISNKCASFQFLGNNETDVK